jgi:hypothetical protein
MASQLANTLQYQWLILQEYATAGALLTKKI